EQRGLAARIPALLVVDAVSVADVEIAGLKGLDRRIQLPRARLHPLVQVGSCASGRKFFRALADDGRDGRMPPAPSLAPPRRSLCGRSSRRQRGPPPPLPRPAELSGAFGVALKPRLGVCRIGRRRYPVCCLLRSENAGFAPLSRRRPPKNAKTETHLVNAMIDCQGLTKQ